MANENSMKRQLNILRRDAQLQARFIELYEKKRIRVDDVIKQLSEEFFLAERTIYDKLHRK